MKKVRTSISLCIAATILLSSCAVKTENKEMKSSTQAETSLKTAKEEALDYNNQGAWKQVSGEMQSPINIKTSKVENLEDDGKIETYYDQSITKAENNGHSIQVGDSGYAQINGRSFALVQFHFHAQSEHTIDGKHFPLEVHFVNQAQDGRLAVIAVFFEEGEENKGFQEVLDDVNNNSNNPITNINTMIPQNMSYYHYIGSLTTPPLTENVEWYIMKNTVTASKEQITQFKKLYRHNNRKIQALNGRSVLLHNE